MFLPAISIATFPRVAPYCTAGAGPWPGTADAQQVSGFAIEESPESFYEEQHGDTSAPLIDIRSQIFLGIQMPGVPGERRRWTCFLLMRMRDNVAVHCMS
jgi:hypothetical protein